MLKKEVIERAQKFCEENNIDTYPVNIVELCEKQGISVFEAYLPKEVSGFIVIQEENFENYNTNRLIVVNLSDLASRKRFTIAHELAHYILHKPVNENLYAHRDAGQNGGIEREANIFASNLLMPEHLVKNAVQDYAICSENELFDFQIVRMIASDFAVSSQAAQVRLEQLRLI